MTGTDRELLARLTEGPEAPARAALAALYDRHGGPVLRFLRGVLPDPNDADDVLQDTFLAAHRHAAAFRGEDARPWLLGIAANRARDLRRGRGRRVRRERAVSRPEGQAPSGFPSGPGADPAGEAADLEAALAALGDRDRAVLELRHVQGRTHQEVAAVLGVSLRTAKGWAARALDHLRARLGRDSR